MKENKQINPNEYGYTGEEEVKISSREFQLIKTALEQGLKNVTKLDAVEVLMYLNRDTGERVENPSQEDLMLGKVLVTTDKEATFDQNNIRYVYDMTKLTREMLMAQELMMDIHLRNIESDVAKPLEELKLKFERLES